MTQSDKRGIYVVHIFDRLLFRRTFALKTALSPLEASRQLAEASNPVPQNAFLGAGLAVAVAPSEENKYRFEAHIRRNGTGGQSYSSSAALGTILIMDGTTWIRGEMRPSPNIARVYILAVSLFVLYLVASIVSAVFLPVQPILSRMLLLIASLGTSYMLWMLAEDLRMLRALLISFATE